MTDILGKVVMDVVDRVKEAARVHGFDEEAADAIALMEAHYQQHLTAGGTPGADAAKTLFAADTAAGVFWFDAWIQARHRAGIAF